MCLVIAGTSLQELDQQVYNTMKKGHRPNTRRNTRSQAASYQKFCDTFELNEFPADEWQLSRYAVYTANRVTAHGTVENYVGGIRNLQQMAGYPIPSPQSPNYKLTMNGIKADLAKPVKRAMPIDIPTLTDISMLVNYDSEYQFAAYACILTGFYITVRSSNLVPTSTVRFNPHEQLTRWHVGFEQQPGQAKVVTFLIEWSKTNQNMENEMWIPVSRATEPEVCLVRVLKRYFDKVPASNSDPCFCYHNQQGKLKALTYAQLNKQLKEWVDATGRDGSRATTHALRRGGSNHAIRSGLDPVFVRLMGGWSSDCFLKYIDFDLDMRVAATVKFNQ